jgi:hypothetical protein
VTIIQLLSKIRAAQEACSIDQLHKLQQHIEGLLLPEEEVVVLSSIVDMALEYIALQEEYADEIDKG